LPQAANGNLSAPAPQRILNNWSSLMTTPTLVHNDDSYSCLGNIRIGHAREDLAQWVDWIFDTPMQAYVGCCAQPDMCYFDTKIGELVGARPGIRLPSAQVWHLQRLYAELRAQGTDQIRVQAKRAQERGKLFLAGIRLSDAHHRWTHNIPEKEYFLYPQHTLEHPEQRIRKADGSLDVTLDYSLEEVRNYRFAIIEELVRNYPVNGVELDFLRWCSHFPFPATPEQIDIMTGYIRRIRNLLDDEAKRRGDGKRLILGTRTPRTLAECPPNGLDPDTWIRKGLVDYISPCAFLFTDMNVLLDEWVSLAKGSDCRILHSIQPWWGGYHGDFLKYRMAYTIELPEYRAYAANGWASGANGMHSFNVCCELPSRLTEVQDMFNVISKPASVWAGPRHYQFFPTSEDNGITGTEHSQSLLFKEINLPQSYRFLMGDGTRTDKITGKLVWRIRESVFTDSWRVRLNGQDISPDKIRATACYAGMHLRPGAGLPPHYAFEVDLANLPSLKLHNELEITPLHLESTWSGERRMETVEAWCQDN
jgi:hypothetical protein